jgi:hypothetical protein
MVISLDLLLEMTESGRFPAAGHPRFLEATIID